MVLQKHKIKSLTNQSSSEISIEEFPIESYSQLNTAEALIAQHLCSYSRWSLALPVFEPL